jgi:hypothetical protein
MIIGNCLSIIDKGCRYIYLRSKDGGISWCGSVFCPHSHWEVWEVRQTRREDFHPIYREVLICYIMDTYPERAEFFKP